MPNRLADATSPYLLQHKDNPVDWYPWGEAALKRAKDEDRPIFLSIGYAACHWCHVMAHESFEDPAVAALMNASFINVKVDREERPDLDSIYMSAVVALTGQGGWPMSVFLTPSGAPFFGGTYFPPEPRHGMPAFSQVLRGVHEAWIQRRDEVLAGSADIVRHLQSSALSSPEPGAPTLDDLAGAVRALWQTYDGRLGGWGGAPKFPQPMTIEFLLRFHVLTGDAVPLDMALTTLRAMARGGMYDQLGGGFHRYSVDARWLVPHFEKMLYDNAQLARVYLHAWQLTHDPEFERVTIEILDYVLNEMTDPAGGFYASQDADSEGEEGRFFVWTAAEIDSALGPDSALFKRVYGVTPGGNFEGSTILSRVEASAAAAAALGIDADQAETRLARARTALFERRITRVHPGLDDKVLAGWNGLMLAALAEAGAGLGRQDYLAAARRNGDFLLSEMRTADGRLRRSWRRGEARLAAYLEDYAGVADGLLALYQATFDARYFSAARALADHALKHFGAAAGGFFDTADDHEVLVLRPRDVQDNATPSGSALLTTVLLRLAAFTGEAGYADAALSALGAVTPFLARYPTGFAQWLSAAAFDLAGAHEVALVGERRDPRLEALLAEVGSTYRPFLVLAHSQSGAEPSDGVPLLEGRGLVDGSPAAYVCRSFVCRAPVASPAALKQALARAAADRP